MSTEIGRRAEQAAALYLGRDGYEILAQNWRTRWCEIDIVARKQHVVYFVEVKYRRTDSFGGGLDYITERKVAQMHFAAEFWLAKYQRAGYEYRLAAVEVTGPMYEVTVLLDDL